MKLNYLKVFFHFEHLVISGRGSLVLQIFSFPVTTEG